MTSAFHFMGLVMDEHDRKVQLEFSMSLVPSSLKFTVYLMDKFTSHTLNSERFDFKARACEEDLESRRDWFSSSFITLLGDVFVLEPLESRGKMIEIRTKISWGPCYAVLKWTLGDCHMHVAVRPSPPYRNWVRDNLAPVTWRNAVIHSDRVLDNLRTARTFSKSEASSSSTLAQPSAKNYRDQFCQASSPAVFENFCQTDSRSTAECGIGPDLIHLETTIVPYRSVEFFHRPWPVVWVIVFDEFGVIHDTLWTMPTPLEVEVLVNQFPPETTHETEYVIPADPLIAVPPRRHLVRPPPPPFPRPEPPVERPGYMPAPPGIRAVFTTGAALLRSQPEMNHPRRLLAPRVRDGVHALAGLDVVGIATRWARLTDENPEGNPQA